MGVSVLRREVSVMMEENLWEVGVRVRSESVITFVVTCFKVSRVEPHLLSFLEWGKLQLFLIGHPCSGQFM